MPNRTICEVLSEMRTCIKTLNFSYLRGLIEEMQSKANRMESALWDQKEFDRAERRYKRLKVILKANQEKLDD